MNVTEATRAGRTNPPLLPAFAAATPAGRAQRIPNVFEGEAPMHVFISVLYTRVTDRAMVRGYAGSALKLPPS